MDAPKGIDWASAACSAIDAIVADYDVGIEERLIGSLMIDGGGVIDSVSSRVSEADFHDRLLGEAFSVFCLLQEMGKPLGDPSLIMQYFKRYRLSGKSRDGKTLTTGDVVRWINSVPNASMAPFYADEIRKASQRRSIASSAIRLVSDLAQKGSDAVELSQKFVSRCETIASRSDIKISTISEVAARVVQKVKDQMGRGEVQAMQTGLYSLDAKMAGLADGELCIIAGRPGGGKSAIGMQIASNIAMEGKNVLFVSLEMPDDDLTMRILRSLAKIDSRDIRSGRVTEAQVKSLEEYAATLNFPLSFYSPVSAGFRQIKAAAKLASINQPLDLLVIDYLQRMKPADSRKNRSEQIGEMTRSLSELAKEMQIPVVCMCQLNREADGQPPKLSHLRESGDIEQDANIILAIHTLDGGDGDSHKEIHVLKNRDGNTGKVRLVWKAAAVRFEDDVSMPF